MTHAPRLNPHPDTPVPGTAPLCPDDATLRQGEIRMLVLVGLLAAATVAAAASWPSPILWMGLLCVWAGMALALIYTGWLDLCARLGRCGRPRPSADMEAVANALTLLFPTLPNMPTGAKGSLHAWICPHPTRPRIHAWHSQPHDFAPHAILLDPSQEALLAHLASQGRGLLAVRAPTQPTHIAYTPQATSAHERLAHTKALANVLSTYTAPRRDTPGCVRRAARRLLPEGPSYTYAALLRAENAIGKAMHAQHVHNTGPSLLV